MRRLSDIVFHQNPLTLTAQATVREACVRMRDRRMGSVLITDDDGHLQGIFTGRDAVRVLASGKDPAVTKLKDVMTKNPWTMTPDKEALDALKLMWNGGFRHVPVVKDGRVLGVVSRGDFRGAEQDRFDEERKVWANLR